MITNPILHINADINRERMTTIIIDIESNNESNESLETPLRGILRNASANREVEEIFETRVTSVCFSAILIIIWIPIIFLDLYFGFTESVCLTKEPHYKFLKLITLKTYLIVSGLIVMTGLWAILTTIYLFDPKLDRASNIYLYRLTFVTMYLTSAFSVVWNIMGAITFWGFIFNNINCEQNFISYMFVSLVIKLISSVCTMYATYIAITSD
jgi:hypothetical protein